MSKFLKILKYFGISAVMSIPYLVLIYYNLDAVSAKVLHLNSAFRTFSVIFGIQYCLSLIGSLLFYVRTINRPDKENSGCLFLVFAAISMIVFYQLNDFGEGWISGGNDPFSRLMHPGWSSFIFYLCLTVCLVQIISGTLLALACRKD